MPEVEPPAELFKIPSRKIIGLTIEPQPLNEIRRERLKALGLAADAEYASMERIRKEIAYADRLMAQLGCPVIDVTNKAVEETASKVLEIYYKGSEKLGRKYVYLFEEGNASMRDLLGGKGPVWRR